MSAIVGLYQQNQQPVDRTVFGEMVDVLKHRGPDGNGVWFGDHVGLGHQMLHTTPESLKEEQPMANRQRTIFLSADARIDNRKELIEAFSIPQIVAPATTDAALILKAYDVWGERCPEKLIGAFAFAIWDKVKQRLFCARDHFGLKPFYYASLPGKLFAFASELKAILKIPEVPQYLNEKAVADHLLAPVDVDATITFYKDIFRLAPGHCISVSQERVVQTKYWTLDPGKEIKYNNDADYAEELRALFKEAVACRTRSAFPVGSMLSGGLDSSAIVSMAAEIQQDKAKPIHTYSAVFDKMQQSDERPYINMVLDKYGGQLTSNMISADELSPLRNYDTMLWHQDSAIQAGNLYFFWSLYNKAKQDGVRVILDGFDGDTTLSHGVGYLHELARARRWKTLFGEVRGHGVKWGQPWKKIAWEWFRAYEVAPAAKRIPFVHSARSIARKVSRKAPGGTAPDTAALTWEQVLNNEFSKTIRDDVLPQRGMPHSEREEHFYLLGRPVMQRIIEVWESSAAASGLELRLPFCDRRLLEYCLALPPTQKRRDGWSRVVMRHAMEDILPSGIQWRADKGNLGPSFDHGLLIKAKDDLNRMIHADVGGVGRFVDLDMLSQTHPQFEQESMDNNTLYHWRALSLALWLQYTGM